MRRLVGLVLLVLLGFGTTKGATAQADGPSTVALQAALKAFGGGAIQDVTLAGTAHRIAGSTNDTVPATLQALASGSTQLTYQTSPGALVETRAVDANGIWSGEWVDPKGAQHALAYHNMMAEPDWFFPLLTVMRAAGSTTPLTTTFIGTETFQGVAVVHLRLAASGLGSAQLQSLTQTELYLNATTLLPVAMTYNEHPDNTMTVDIPIQVTFSSYQLLGGVLLPTHVQQSRNNSLYVDLQIHSATLNTGLTISLPPVQ